MLSFYHYDCILLLFVNLWNWQIKHLLTQFINMSVQNVKDWPCWTSLELLLKSIFFQWSSVCCQNIVQRPLFAQGSVLLLCWHALHWNGSLSEGQRKSIIDYCLYLFEFCSACSPSFLQVWKARHPTVFSLSLNLLCGLQQDLKDLMRKAGEVTFVDAHRPNRNEGWVSETSVRVLPTSVLTEALVLNTGWWSLHHAATWRMPSPSLTAQNWTDASWKSLRTAGSEFLTGILMFCTIEKLKNSSH